MEYRRTYPTRQPYSTVPTSLLDSDYAGFAGYDSPNFVPNFVPNFPQHQCSRGSINPISNPGSDSFMEGSTWAAQDNPLGISTGLVAEPQLQVASAVQMQTAVADHSADEQHWRQGVARLENRIGRLETLIEGLQNQIEEKTRFFAEVENYIKQLVDWTKYSKVAIESLVAELKEAVKSAS